MMSTTGIRIQSVLAIGLLVILAGYGLAAGRTSSTLSDNDAATFQAPSAATLNGAALRRASRVMHARVKSTDGTTLGRVHDLVLTPDLNGISYVAISTGGIAGLGSTFHAIPWSALTQSFNNTYVASVTKQQLRQTPGFHAAYWPSSVDTGWVVQSTDAGKTPVYRGRDTADSKAVQDRRFSHIKGLPVKDAQGKTIGTIRDMVVAMDEGRIAYSVISHGGLLGMGARYSAVPESAIRLEPDRRVARIDVTPEVLRANSFTPNRWPDLANPGYARELNQAFNVPAGSTALAYVSPGTSTPTSPPASSTAAPAAPSAATTEPAAGDLAATFDPAHISTLEGTVAAQGKFTPAAGGPDMLWLLIRTDDGRTVLANLGPRRYISSQDFYIVRGDRVRLAGSDVTTASGRHVWLPTEVTYNNQVLRLRSASGTPLWEGQTTPSTSGRTSATSGTSATPGAAATRDTDTAGETDEP